MRASVIVPLMLAALFGLGLRYGSPSSVSPPASHSPPAPHRAERSHSPAQAQRPLTPAQAKPAVWTGQAVGHPSAEEQDSIDSALREAGLVISEKYLMKLNPPVEWVPTPEFIQNEKYKIIKKQSQASHTIKDVDVPNPPELTVVTFDLELTDTALTSIREQDRHHRVEERLWNLGRALGGLVLVFGAIAGAIRLDEWTKGYFPLPLKLGLIVLAGVGAAAMWVI
jgi:hypothetical protein